MTPANNPWTPERLDDRFKALEDTVAALDFQVRAVAPVVPGLAAMGVTVDELRRNVRDVETDVKAYVNKSVTAQLMIVSTPLFLGAAGFVVALLTGHVG